MKTRRTSLMALMVFLFAVITALHADPGGDIYVILESSTNGSYMIHYAIDIRPR